MPGLNLDTDYHASVFDSASDLPEYVWDVLRENPVASNVVLSQLLTEARDRRPPTPDQFWIVCGNAEHPVDVILSCTTSSMGTNPIFIVPRRDVSLLDPQYLLPRIGRLVDVLGRVVSSSKRVYSVFAPDLVSNIFAAIWSQHSGVPARECYYHANLTYCTRETFISELPSGNREPRHDVRRAVEADIQEAAVLCRGFSEESAPFVLSQEGSVQEATLLVNKKQLYIHRTNRPGQPSEITSIVAVTRDSDPVIAITKVFTSKKWRRRGCAEELVRFVCGKYLETRDRVILYVAHDNYGAIKCYKNVGFVGLDSDAPPVPGVHSWKEIGFDRGMVDLGHW